MYTLSETQQHYFEDRYALKDKNGKNIETNIDQAWKRVARAIAESQDEAVSFYNLLYGFKFVPGGRILAGAGAENEKTFYNCYVIPVEARRDENRPKLYPGSDSREAIFDTIKTMVDIMSRGGGVGINWSVLRPSGGYLTRISGTSSGPVGWMDVASAAVGEVIQGGSRRGAAMFMLDDWHPDVLNFINAKRDMKKILNANVSVAISDRFMEALHAEKDWELVFPDTTHPDYNQEWDGDIQRWKTEGRPICSYGNIKASKLWESIAKAAHASGEPGVVFLERYNELSTANGQERIISVNPCGEQGLGAYSVCNLGAMNLDAYVRPAHDKTIAKFEWINFSDDVQTAIRFLDNVIDKTFYFLPETRAQQMKLRRIGLGVMGLADALVRMKIRYGSPESIEFVENIFRCMKDVAIVSSLVLADEKGSALGWSLDLYNRPYLLSWLRDNEHVHANMGMRNLFLLTQAPTGTTSLLADVNSGIEPYFNIRTWREDRTGGRWVFAKAVSETVTPGLEYTPDYVVTSKDITVEEHIAVQAAAQKYIDSSVSKTINAPNEQTVDETIKAFTLAYDSGLKGIAYYRDGSRDVQVLNHKNPNETIAELEAKVKQLSAQLVTRSGYYSTKLANNVVQHTVELVKNRDDVCPACLIGIIVFEEGCKKCNDCGWSACE